MLLALDVCDSSVGGGDRDVAEKPGGLLFCMASIFSRSHATARSQQWLRC